MERTAESAQSEEQLLGNQAVAQQVSGVEIDGHDDGHDEARTLVERGFFALYSEPRPPQQVQHWVDVLEGSRLPTERRTALIEKLSGDQESALASQEAAQRWFGDVEAGLTAMDAVSAALSPGVDFEQAVQAAGAQAEAVAGFCREVYLILGFQKEEEEEEEEDVDEPIGDLP